MINAEPQHEYWQKGDLRRWKSEANDRECRWSGGWKRDGGGRLRLVHPSSSTTRDRTYRRQSQTAGGDKRSCRRRPADLAIAILADQLANQKAKKELNFSGILFLLFLERDDSVDHIIVLQMAPSIRACAVAAPLIVCGIARAYGQRRWWRRRVGASRRRA